METFGKCIELRIALIQRFDGVVLFLVHVQEVRLFIVAIVFVAFAEKDIDDAVAVLGQLLGEFLQRFLRRVGEEIFPAQLGRRDSSRSQSGCGRTSVSARKSRWTWMGALELHRVHDRVEIEVITEFQKIIAQGGDVHVGRHADRHLRRKHLRAGLHGAVARALQGFRW